MSEELIHPTAIIDPSARLGRNVRVGPYSYIGADVIIGDDCELRSHIVVRGPTRIGQRNKIFQFASIGEDCQDKKFAGEPTELVIGDDNVFRECVTIHRGTMQDKARTTIGHGNLCMAYVHIAHDCVVGSHNILANNATLAGHVELGDHVILGGFTGVHQFCKIGSHSFAAVSSVLVQDLPPYVMAQGHNAVPRAINSEGLRRRGFAQATISNIKRAFRLLYRSQLRREDALSQIRALNEPALNPFVEFIESSERGIIR